MNEPSEMNLSVIQERMSQLHDQINRVVLGHGIVHVAGDASLPPEEEKDLRRRLVERALETLESDEQT